MRARQRVPEDVLEVVYEGVKYRLDRETCVAARELGRKASRLPNLGRKAIAEHAWSDETVPMGSNAIDVQMSRLRAKLPNTGVQIVTVRGAGYRLEEA